MCKNRVNRRFLTYFLFISAILFNIFNVQLINAETINGNNSLETYLPDLIPNEDAINQTSHIISSVSSIEEDVIQSTQSTIQIQEVTLNTIEETANTIEFNIKHEISNPPILPAVESRIIPTTVTESSSPQLLSIGDRRFLLPDMDKLNPVKVQKCCPSGQIMILGQPGEQSICQISMKEFNMPVFYTNSTHYWNFTNTASGDVEIVARDPCKQSKYFLDPNDENDTFRLFSNSSLYIPFSMDMLSIDQYCVDTIQGSDMTFTSAIICTSPPKVNIFHQLYIAGFIVSIFFLIGLAIFISYLKNVKDDHKTCLIFHTGTMATSYIFITIQTIFYTHFNYNINLIIAYFIYYLNINYYLWLNILSYDIYRCVRNPNINVISYMKWYKIATFLIPIIFVLFSFIDEFNPPLPNLYLEYKFSSSDTFIILLYILPVIVSTVGNLLITCCISLPKERYNNVKDFIATFQSKDWKPPPRNISEIRKMFRRICALYGITLLFFILDIVIFFLPSTGKQQPHFIMRDILYCLKGLCISLIFFKKKWCCSKCCEKNNDNPNNETELGLMTNGNV